ncbi:MAG: uroporphyrinogen decarboxylase family protein [Anaerolineae bacterium]
MNSTERILAVLNFRQPDHMPMMDMAYWPETMDRWVAEGLPEEVLHVPEGDYPPGVDMRTYWGRDYERRMQNFQAEEYFGLDHWLVVPRLPIIETIFPFFEEVVLEDRGDKVLVRDRLGVTQEQPKQGTAFPGFVEFPVKTREDYEQLRPRLDPDTPGRYCRGWDRWAEWLQERGIALCLWFRGLFGFPRDLLGFENLCLAYHLDPDLVQTIVEDRCAFVKRLFTPALERFPIHCVLIWEDMAYNHGAMISPATFRRFMLPYYQDLSDFFHGKGVDRILVDSDGNIVELCSLFVEGRVDGVYPLEIAAGSHPRALRERYPNLALLGGVDKRALAAGPEAIDRELARLVPVVEQGGYIPMVDHLVPPDVSLENYRYYLERRRELF